MSARNRNPLGLTNGDPLLDLPACPVRECPHCGKGLGEVQWVHIRYGCSECRGEDPSTVLERMLKAVDLLSEIQWSSGGAYDVPECPKCGGMQPNHEATCALWAMVRDIHGRRSGE